ncbi:selina-4(15),7(11)-diene synthase [Streptomyces kanasensis]|uniref:selina-4(15),7(11)-diene synthase n=1 Tax=Streptomyces kanasensis TaxID=936756 RepID=UPI0036FE92CE
MGPGPTVPPLFSPIPPAIHPCHARADARTAAWAETFRIGSDELRGRLVSRSFGTFAARVLPEGREEVVSLLADFVLWLSGLGHGEEGEHGRRPGDLAGELHRLLRVAQNPEVPLLLDDPLAAGLRDLRLRIDRYGTPGQAARWADALREYCFCVVWEAAHRRAGTVPDLDDYTLTRLYGGATSAVLPLLEIGHGYELQPHERDRTAVRAAAEMASFVITWDDDIRSYHEETEDGGATGSPLTVLRVLEHHEGLTPQQALRVAISHRDRVTRLYLRLTEQLAAHGSPQLRQYLRTLGSFLRGAQDRGVGSGRYARPNDPAGPPTTFRDTPVDGGGEPLDIPAVSWWWNLLAPGGDADATAGPSTRTAARGTP